MDFPRLPGSRPGRNTERRGIREPSSWGSSRRNPAIPSWGTPKGRSGHQLAERAARLTRLLDHGGQAIVVDDGLEFHIS